MRPQQLDGIDNAALRELDSVGLLGGDAASSVTDIIGVLAGIKPCAFIFRDDTETEPSDILLDRLGLAHTTSKIKNLIYISKQKKLAERLAFLHEQTWGKNASFLDENREIGRLLGYPATATDYFLRRLLTFETSKALPVIKVKRTKNTVSEYFEQLVLSPEHYEEELASYCQPLEEAVRLYAPKTYRSLKRKAMRERFRVLLKRLGGRDEAISDFPSKTV